MLTSPFLCLMIYTKITQNDFKRRTSVSVCTNSTQRTRFGENRTLWSASWPRKFIYSILQRFHDKLLASRKSGSGRCPSKLRPRKLVTLRRLFDHKDDLSQWQAARKPYYGLMIVNDALYKSSKEKERKEKTYNVQRSKFLMPKNCMADFIGNFIEIVFHPNPLDPLDQWKHLLQLDNRRYTTVRQVFNKEVVRGKCFGPYAGASYFFHSS